MCFSERLDRSVQMLAPEFLDDPVFAWLLHTMQDHKSYLHKLFHSLVKASVLNGGIVFEAGNWGCCAVVLPLGKDVGNPLTIFQAGLISVVLNVGLSGTKVKTIHVMPLGTYISTQLLTGRD